MLIANIDPNDDEARDVDTVLGLVGHRFGVCRLRHPSA